MSTAHTDFLNRLPADEQRIILQAALSGLRDPLTARGIPDIKRADLVEHICEHLRVTSDSFAVVQANPGGKAGRNPKSRTIQVREFIGNGIYLVKAQFRYDPAIRDSFHRAVAKAGKWLQDYTGFEVLHSVKRIAEMEQSNCLLRLKNGKRKPHSNRKR